MATSTETRSFELDIPKGVNVKINGNIIEVSGSKGKISKDLSKIPVNIHIKDDRIIINSYSLRKKQLAIANTCRSILKNMIYGVQNGYTYKLKIIYSHFPISVKVKDRDILIENFLGERSARVAKIAGDCKVKVEGEDLIVQGASLDDVSQTAANIELATMIKKKDVRVFLDGIYIYSKEKNM